MPALQVHAGARAREKLQQHGLRPADVRVIAGAAGGPKGLVLNPLDRFIFGHWLAESRHTVHLLGASIGAWRLACAALNNPAQALERLAEDYLAERFPTRPDGGPVPRQMSDTFAARLRQHFQGRESEVLGHPRYRLHVFTSLGRGRLLRREGGLRTPLGYLGAFTANFVSRRAMGGWLERVVFSDARNPLPLRLKDYRTRKLPFDALNMVPAVLASCSIPFVLAALADEFAELAARPSIDPLPLI